MIPIDSNSVFIQIENNYVSAWMINFQSLKMTSIYNDATILGKSNSDVVG